MELPHGDDSISDLKFYSIQGFTSQLSLGCLSRYAKLARELINVSIRTQNYTCGGFVEFQDIPTLRGSRRNSVELGWRIIFSAK